MRAAGYRVAACGKNDLHKGRRWCGLDGWTPLLGQLGFTEAVDQSGKMDAAQNGWPQPQDSYAAYLHRLGLMQTHFADYKRRREEATYPTATWPSPLSREHYTDDFCGRMALRLLDGLPVGQLWHLWVNFPGPHDPFDPPLELQRLYDGVEFPGPVGPPTAEADHQQIRRNYAACIEGLDQWVGWIIDAIQRRGELDDTIIVFSSDHGEMLGDLGRWNKSQPFEPSVRVPLIVAGPDIATGKTSESLVELCDLAATMLDLAGAASLRDSDSRSLVPILHGQSDRHRDATVSALGKWRMITDGRWKLVETEGAPLQLFDLHADPTEVANLVSREEHAGLIAALRDSLAQEHSEPNPNRGPLPAQTAG